MSTQFNFDHLFGGEPIQPRMSAESYLPPRSRTTDAPSSHRAERELKASGAMKGQRQIALALVTENPGKTAAQLAEIHSPYDEVLRFKTMIWLRKRLPELREMKLAYTSQTGSEDLRWWPK